MSDARVARNQPIVTALRTFMDAEGLSPPEVSDLLGLPKGATKIYSWLSGTSAPVGEAKDKLAELLSVPIEALTPIFTDKKDESTYHRVEKAVAVRQSRNSDIDQLEATLQTPRTPTPPRATEVLAFAVDTDGLAVIRLNTKLPMERATTLLKTLLDFGLVLKSE